MPKLGDFRHLGATQANQNLDWIVLDLATLFIISIIRFSKEVKLPNCITTRYITFLYVYYSTSLLFASEAWLVLGGLVLYLLKDFIAKQKERVLKIQSYNPKFVLIVTISTKVLLKPPSKPRVSRMPASNIDSYLQDARNSFDAVRPAPICTDANQSMGQCQNVHISTNCYYGYHDLKHPENNHVDTDCEMVELEVVLAKETPSKTISRKRCADDDEYPQRKRLREGTFILIYWNLTEFIQRFNVIVLIKMQFSEVS